MTPTEQKFLLWCVMALLGILAYVGRLAVSKLSEIATSVNQIEKDLGILANDHTNLKDEVKDVKQRVTKLETA